MKYKAYLFDPSAVALRRGYSSQIRRDVTLSYQDGELCYVPYSEKSRFALEDLKKILGVPDLYEMGTSEHGYRSPSGSHWFRRGFPCPFIYWKVDAQTYLRLHSDPTPLAQIVLGILPPLDVIDLLGD